MCDIRRRQCWGSEFYEKCESEIRGDCIAPHGNSFFEEVTAGSVSEAGKVVKEHTLLS